MLRHTAGFAAAVILAAGFPALDVPKEAASDSWQVDNRLSDAQLITEATTDYGKTTMNVTLGFARVNGILRIEGNDLKKSRVDLAIYPATSILPSIDENGIFLSDWLSSRSAYHVLVCFHSKQVVQTPDGRLRAIGNLSLTRVDRNVELTMSNEGLSEIQADPPPVIHRSSHEVTFVLEFPAAVGSGQKEGTIRAVGTTSVSREDFPQMLKTAVSTYWPSLVQEENCEIPIATEASTGSHCTVKTLKTPELPEPPRGANGKEFNALVGEHLTIVLHLRLMPKAPGQSAAAEK
jgi:polyisoprenoid-binding protein YceI